jgi:hypothetical protein
MFLLRFIHAENTLYVGNKKYTADCTVRNEINGWRQKHELVKSMPINEPSKPCYPRKFPTGLWKIMEPVKTDDPEFAPVKIPTDAARRILTWNANADGYTTMTGKSQIDNYYHLHYSQYKTTLGCIRLNSSSDALEIAETVSRELKRGEVWIEVLAGR